MCFYFQHWEFVTQYLKVAVMIKFPFKEQTEEVLAESLKRKRILRAFKYFIYAMMSLFSLLVITAISKENELYVRIFWALMTMTMVIILITSMTLIDNLRKKLYNGNSKLQNQKLRRLHIGLFAIVAVLTFILITMQIIDNKKIQSSCVAEDEELTQQIIILTNIKHSLEITISFVWFLIVGTMLMMYRRYLAPLSS